MKHSLSKTINNHGTVITTKHFDLKSLGFSDVIFYRILSNMHVIKPLKGIVICFIEYDQTMVAVMFFLTGIISLGKEILKKAENNEKNIY